MNSCRNYTRHSFENVDRVSRNRRRRETSVVEHRTTPLSLSLSLEARGEMQRSHGFFRRETLGDGGEEGRSRKFSSTCYSFTRSYERDVLVLRYVILGR